MMLEKLLPSFFGLTLLLCSCSSEETVEISALCERDEIGNYVIKWETSPRMEGTVKLYVSNQPDGFDYSRPIDYIPTSSGVTTYVTNDNITRMYFRLTFSDKYTRTLGAREVSTDYIQNFRDLGGYRTASKKELQWGKVYRSGSLTHINDWDSLRLNNLALKTFIDLRAPSEIALAPVSYSPLNVVSIPLVSESLRDIFPRIHSGKMKKGDVYLLLQDRYLRYIDSFDKELKQALELFLDESNYPIVISSSFGKDRAGLLSFFLLYALGVQEEDILHDYLLTNRYLDKKEFAYLVSNSNSSVQETLTSYLLVDEELFSFFTKYINKEFGSTDQYLVKQLGFTKEKQKQLRNILLE